MELAAGPAEMELAIVDREAHDVALVGASRREGSSSGRRLVRLGTSLADLMNKRSTQMLNNGDMLVRRLRSVLLVFPGLFGIAWLLSFGVSRATTEGGFLWLSGMLKEPVVFTDVWNFWAVALVGGWPFQVAVVILQVPIGLQTVANDVAKDQGLAAPSAHAELVQRASRVLSIDVAVVLLVCASMATMLIWMSEVGYFYLEGIPPRVFTVLAAIVMCGVAVFAPTIPSYARTLIMRDKGRHVLHFVEEDLMPKAAAGFILSCILLAYAGALCGMSPPFTLSVASVLHNQLDPCGLPSNASFAEYTNASIGCQAQVEFIAVRLKVICSLGLWANMFALAFGRMGLKLMLTETPKFPLAPFLGKTAAAVCVSFCMPLQSAMILLPASMMDVGSSAWVIRLTGSWWFFVANLCLWGTALVLMCFEVFLRRFEAVRSGAELEVAQPGGETVKLRELLTSLVNSFIEADARAREARPDGPTKASLADTKFVGEPNDLVTGRPIDAALGIEHFMNVRSSFVMPVAKDGVEAIVREVQASGTPVDKECLHYILHERAGSSSVVFSNGNLQRDCTPDGAIHHKRLNADGLGKSFDDFCNDPAALVSMLAPPHVLALRLYTTAAYKSLNTPLRNTDPARPPHGFPLTIKYICDGIGQLRAVGAAGGEDGPLDLWRGLKNLRVQDSFIQRGGTEQAPMSTTTDLKIAVQYSLGDSSLLFKLRTNSFMQRGADLTFLSAFPGEAEILFPPLTYLRPTGKCMHLSFADSTVKYTVVEVEPIF
eukprot:CAMPEP_0115839736 /NCGR_PEP_ID=MMETSP0287-20121206/6405_1 /TAXON_ID=412157 /ORGANISM="Chrysochromulina rotalis, Strain UIO044" /LENGTH=770 /DNA_ID=CAMNT_0003293317 /DNA_START=17 /DNA_END=2329 /DNA_ORIENTATION=+